MTTEKTYRLGLLSDTHMPQRWNQLPSTLNDIFADVDFILHAGDVGELWVLDQLSAIAPTIAVHGNDEPADTPRQLPHKQLLTIAGQRLLLWHGHYPNRVDEMESRRLPEMRPKLERIARHAQQVGANFVHFGHWHIPLLCQIEGVTLINAGGIASGNFITRQRIQTAAVMTLATNGRFTLQHYNLATGQPHPIADVIDMGFMTAATPYTDIILAPELLKHPATLRQNQTLYTILRQLAPRCWWGDQETLTAADFIEALQAITPQTTEIDHLIQTLASLPRETNNES